MKSLYPTITDRQATLVGPESMGEVLEGTLLAVAAHLKKGTWIPILSGDLVLCEREILNIMINLWNILKVEKRMNMGPT
jgi:hypothetical protein